MQELEAGAGTTEGSIEGPLEVAIHGTGVIVGTEGTDEMRSPL